MLELLAIPAYLSGPRSLEEWAEQLRLAGGPVAIEHDPPNAAWILAESLGLRGFALLENGKVEAIDFELSAADTGPARAALEAAAIGLDWEIHEDDEDEDDTDGDDAD